MFSVEHLLHQGLRGTGWTLLWLHWLALGHKGKTCAAGCWDDISRVIACHNRICIYIYIFQEMPAFNWDATLSGKNNMSFPGVRQKSIILDSHCENIVPPTFFVPSITSSRSHSFCKTSTGIKASVRMAPLRFFAWRMVFVK